MKIRELNHQPVFDDIEEMVDQLSGDADVLTLAPAKFTIGSRKLRKFVASVVLVMIGAGVGRLLEEFGGYILAQSLTETGFGFLFLALLVYAVYRMWRPNADVLAVTDRGVIALAGIERTVHGVSAENMFELPADEIERFRYTKWQPLQTVIRFESGATKDVLNAIQHRFWRKKSQIGPRGTSLRDVVSLLRRRAAVADGGWGKEASMLVVHAQVYGVVFGLLFGIVFLGAGAVGLAESLGGPDVEELYRDAEAAYVAGAHDSAAAVFTRAAREDHAPSQARLGWMYEHGEGVERDLEQAARWYRPAAEAGNAMARSGLGYLYYMGAGPLERDSVQGASLIASAADQDEPRALSNWGAILQARGDEAQAVEFFQRSADHGHMRGIRNLAWAHYQGRGTPQDYGKARRWFEQAAEMEDASSQAMTGYIYDLGLERADPANLERAMYWYEKAAAQGDTIAQKNLAILERVRPSREAVLGLSLTLRDSHLEDGTQVLRISNSSGRSLPVKLTCTRAGRSKTLSVSLPRYGTEEVGFLEGWTGNFQSGDRCDIHHGSARMKSFSVP